MVSGMKWWNKKKIKKWLRILHRDLGYFAVGISLVYAVSGIILNHKKPGVDPAFKAIADTKTISTHLSMDELVEFWNAEIDNVEINRIVQAKDYYRLYLDGGMGDYTPETGELNFEVYKKRVMVFFINKLHLNKKKHWLGVADFSAIVLIFLALSGLFMVTGKKGFNKRGVWFMIAGFLLIFIYIWI